MRMVSSKELNDRIEAVNNDFIPLASQITVGFYKKLTYNPKDGCFKVLVARDYFNENTTMYEGSDSEAAKIAYNMIRPE